MKTLLAIVLVLAGLMAPCGALTFGEWSGDNGIEVNPSGDPDGDGVSNAMEYALHGLNPNRGDAPEMLPQMVFGTRAAGTALPWNDPSVIVYYGTEPPLSGFWYLGIRYKPRADTEGVTLRPQFSWWGANLSAWLDGRSCFLAPVAHTDGFVIQWMAGMFRPAAPPQKSYVRLLVTLE